MKLLLHDIFGCDKTWKRAWKKKNTIFTLDFLNLQKKEC